MLWTIYSVDFIPGLGFPRMISATKKPKKEPQENVLFYANISLLSTRCSVWATNTGHASSRLIHILCNAFLSPENLESDR